MSETELLSINVWLAGRSYRIRIKPEEEEPVRKAIKIADEKLSEMRLQYTGKDDQDFLAMVLLMYAADTAVDVLQNPFLRQSLQSMTERIDKLLAADD